jgi:hypothetical protein
LQFYGKLFEKFHRELLLEQHLPQSSQLDTNTPEATSDLQCSDHYYRLPNENSLLYRHSPIPHASDQHGKEGAVVVPQISGTV